MKPYSRQYGIRHVNLRETYAKPVKKSWIARESADENRNLHQIVKLTIINMPESLTISRNNTIKRDCGQNVPGWSYPKANF